MLRLLADGVKHFSKKKTKLEKKCRVGLTLTAYRARQSSRTNQKIVFWTLYKEVSLHKLYVQLIHLHKIKLICP